MTAELWALVLAVGVPLALRLIDLLIPKGRHLRIIDRFTVPDDPDEETDTWTNRRRRR